MISSISVHEMNRRVTRTLAICSVFMLVLLLLKLFHIYDFNKGLTLVIGVVGLLVTLSPAILFAFKVNDEFLKYYTFTGMALLIAALGSFNDIGVYMTFVLIPIASLLYFNKRFTSIMVGVSYVMMVCAVYLNSAGKMEVQYRDWTHFETFRAYIIGFTIEYLIISLFLFQIMRRAEEMIAKEREIALLAKAQEYRYELLVKGTKDVIFDYSIKDRHYHANRSLFTGLGQNEEIDLNADSDAIKKRPAIKKLFERLLEVQDKDESSNFELDFSYEKDGLTVPLWYEGECFVVRENDLPVSIIGKLHNNTQTKLAQQNLEKQRMSEMINTITEKKNSIYELAMSASDTFTEADYSMLSHGHQFLARMLDTLKYAENLPETLDKVLGNVADYFHVDRICVIDTSMADGTNRVDYQWNSKADNKLNDYFPNMSRENMEEIIATYDKHGYIEINPEQDILMVNQNNSDALKDFVMGNMLGNQIWIPTLADGKYNGSIFFDKYDTTPYTLIEKFLFAEVANLLSAYVTRLNAQEANRAKSEFLSTMSHEIRTPMNAIVGLTEVALREEMSASMRKCLKTVQSSAFGLLALINDILDFSKIEAGKIELVSENFQTLSLVNDLYEIVKARNADKLDLKLNLAEDMPGYLCGDVVRIKQVMINFCTNAIKYTDKGSVSISLKTEKTDESHCNFIFAVSDTGIGIKREDLTKIFKSYSQVDTSINHHKEGTGLGLAISKQLVDLMSGTVSVESEYGKGSTFSFVIPLEVVDWKKAGRLDDFNYDEKEEETETKTFTAPTAEILVVDDTAINLTVVEALLKPVKMKIDKADNGLKAIEKTKEKKYDLIFMDHFMPVMDGVEATEKIRNMIDNPNRRTPIIALTADAVAGVKEELLSKGMDDFLTKPIIIQKMYATLAKWLPKEKIEG